MRDRNSPLGIQRLRSLGGGAVLNIANRARLDLTFAVPLTTLPGEPGKRDPRLLVSFSTGILPWSKN